MDELIKMVSKKAGISEKQARQAVTTVMEFLDDKLPGPLAQQITSVMKGGSMGSLDDLTKSLGDLFSKK